MKTRYYGDYYGRCREAHRSTGQRCVICTGKSTHVHHAYYGDDVVGTSIFPICESCHGSVCHSRENWIPNKQEMKAKNTPAFINKLRIQFLYVRVVTHAVHGDLSYRK
jgi:hypothetical protein